MFLTITNLLTDDELAGLRRRLLRDDAAWVDGRATAGWQGASVKHNRQVAEGSRLAEACQAIVQAALVRCKDFQAAALPKTLYPPMFNRYGPGMTFGAHVDGSLRYHPRTGLALRTDLSATLFLSDPQDYDGGALEISDSFGIHAVKLKAGDLVLYPATSVHQVTPVTRGERLACFFWVQSLIRDDARRRILWDLHTGLKAVAETPPLTQAYENLLRYWVEV